MQDNRNLFLALILSVAVLVGWQYFYEMPRREQIRIEQAIQQQKRVDDVPERKHDDHEKTLKIVPRDDAIAQTNRVLFANEEIEGSINLKGLRFDDLVLRRYYVHAPLNGTQKEDRVILFSPSNTEASYFAEIGWLSGSDEIRVPNEKSIWKSDRPTISQLVWTNFTWDNGEGLRFFVSVKLDDNYLFEIEQKVENNSGREVSLLPFGLVNRNYSFDHQSFFILHEGAIGVLGDKLEEVTYSTLEEDKKKSYKSNKDGWIGIADKYWFSALVPDREVEFDANFTYSFEKDLEKFQADYRMTPIRIENNATSSIKMKLIAGAKELNVLDFYSEHYQIKLFDRLVDFGWFYFLTKPMLQFLSYLNNYFGNFGVAIIVMTIIVKLLLFPTASKSYRSMNAMKALQPKIKKLQETYKNDTMRVQKEMMALYKKEGVNPAAGCLPMLIQIPVFFSLYKVLFVALEMRHAPFFGWVVDLSAQDPSNIFNIFGLLAWNPPSYLHIGAWPILMAFTMFIQQKLSPAPNDPVQANMMKVLPFIFLIMFASFPVGLVIYWAVSNSLSIVQQYYLLKTNVARPPEEVNKKKKRHASK